MFEVAIIIVGSYFYNTVVLRHGFSYEGGVTLAAKFAVSEPSETVSTVCVKSNVTDSTTPTLI